MSKYFRYFEYAYLIFAAFFLFEAVRIWNSERSRAYIFLFFVAIAVFMFFFKRRFRRRFEERNK
ncbi:MAG: hypothetical protein VX712_06590 [Bacteroidota bacterium]|uniref:Uncharacterized protein n=1 Tax=Christiangramia flava JLT2011 TaxID=1229726 RepID=A0A1L7I2A7_9FLAO|nr:hypothetical protein [Christiangramia flava]APU67736.1 hypothetical protein GRFL_1012 [Christiangramia flava JLT2011]MAM17860.1 hypothetical protein [Christiangramia sp.]MEE2771867.1 hypothetical protein [Bacteroidota bacterium]OSS40240.1 hypothetical protein C723_0548 [Christiangramia flava JLT2011]|tara:strand:- start:839 stop:1030 length:192 start_codon:yes stop_codon:yes gene_type:complete